MIACVTGSRAGDQVAWKMGTCSTMGAGVSSTQTNLFTISSADQEVQLSGSNEMWTGSYEFCVLLNGGVWTTVTGWELRLVRARPAANAAAMCLECGIIKGS